LTTATNAQAKKINRNTFALSSQSIKAGKWRYVQMDSYNFLQFKNYLIFRIFCSAL